MKIVAIVQARTSSSRLPGKVLLPLANDPMIIFQLKRIKRSKNLDNIVLATSDQPSDDQLALSVQQAGFSVFRGDLNDVLARYLHCAVRENADIVVRITGDCPFQDPVLVDEIIDEFVSGDWDYLSNCSGRRFFNCSW